MKINSLINFLILIIFSTSVMLPKTHAQELEALFNGEIQHGGFGGPAVFLSNIDGNYGLFVGGRGGWIINFNERHAVHWRRWL